MRLLPLLLAALLAAPAAAQSPIRADAIRADVRTLSSDAFEGRGPGTRGETRTLEHLRRAFAAAGLKPGGPNGSWFQDVPLTRVDTQRTAVVARAAGKPVALVTSRDWVASLGQAGSVALTDLPVVFGGFGIRAPELGWDDFAGVDLTGKVVLLLANDPDYDQPSGPFGGPARSPLARAKAANAYAAGAAAVVQVHQQAATRRLWSATVFYAAEPRYRLAEAPAPTGPARLAVTLSEAATRRLVSAAGLDFAALEAAAKRPGFRATPLPGVTLSLSGRAAERPFRTRNILARLDGTTRAAETVVIGAHWDAYGTGVPDERGDTIRNGAVDNAIGTATMVEVARAFARGPRPQRSLLFIGYTSEEDGLLGAYHYAAHPVRPLATTAAVFNLDPHLALSATRSMELIGAGRTDLEDLFAEVVRGEGLAVEPEQLPDENWYSRSDHLAFAEAGVPAIYFRAGRDLIDGGAARGTAWVADYDLNRYHQRSDAFDPAWDLAAAAQEGTIVYRMARRVADGGGWPAWRGTLAAGYAARRSESAAERR
ncbi:M28 family peptidase [Sphingomonas guangdongensis]|nr:M28 family peptidase [Sphingomonas guangdongensis]